MKFTNIEMDWTDTGARVLSSVPLLCPLCGEAVTPNVEHLCGDRAPEQKQPRKRVSRRLAKAAGDKGRL